MDKISSILPGNSRVTSVDLTEAHPARPGAPANGRKVGRNTVSDRVTLSEKAKTMTADEALKLRNPKEFSRAKSVEEINRKFFDTRLKPTEKEVPASAAVTEDLMDLDVAPAPRQEDVVSAYETKAEKSPRLSIEA